MRITIRLVKEVMNFMARGWNVIIISCLSSFLTTLRMVLFSLIIIINT